MTHIRFSFTKMNLLDVRRMLLILCHAVLISFSIILAFMLRFDFTIPEGDARLLIAAIWIAVLIKSAVFMAAGLNRGWWRYVGIADLVRVLIANAAASALVLVLILALGWSYPRSVHAIDFLLCFLLTAGARFAVRIYNEALKIEISQTARKGILIYGAGQAGIALLKEIRSSPSLGYEVIGFLDDNPKLLSAVISNAPVLGTGRDAAMIVEHHRTGDSKIDQIVIAMPSANGRQMREAVANCRAAGVSCKTVPGIAELLVGKHLSSQIRSISVDDLLSREQVHLDEAKIEQKIAGCVIMVTGAAGSIGSELCRRIAHYEPRKLVAFDQAESELYRLDYELRRQYPSLDLATELGDIRQIRRVEEVVVTHSVESMFHAAAYKHVPLLEAHTMEAVKNNILGTWNVVGVAYKNKVSRFVMISSDKAVNPTNVMGATKRIAELIVAAASKRAGNRTKFVSVRFGNVLGSNGSVVPLFQSQIAAGGPVTVTHPEMRRYFLSVREAVQLVLQASTMGNGCDIFVLDMGEPVRIMDLAHNMIRLAGLIPGEDIEVRVTGLRPGEKLIEELVSGAERLLPTYHDKIKILENQPMDPEVLTQWIGQLPLMLARRDSNAIMHHIRRMVPEYRPAAASASQGQPRVDVVPAQSALA